MKMTVYSIFSDGKEIAKVPFGALETTLGCILSSLNIVSISLSVYEEFEKVG